MSLQLNKLMKSRRFLLTTRIFLSFYFLLVGFETLHLLIEAHTACPSHPGEVIEGTIAARPTGLQISQQSKSTDFQTEHEHCFVTQFWKQKKNEKFLSVISSFLSIPSDTVSLLLAPCEFIFPSKSLLLSAPKTSPPLFS